MIIIPSASAKSLTSLSLLLILSILLGGCAAYGPRGEVGPIGPALSEVRGNPDAYFGTLVRWGGSIARVENRRDETWIEVVEHRLNANGYPQPSVASDGRFIARIPGFLDPAVYAEGRLLTVAGTVESTTRRNIGEYPYTFPVVAADEYRLWEERRERDVIYYYPYDYWWPSYRFGHPFYDRW